VVLISLTLLEILILIPYVLHNNLHAFDAIGHYAAVLFMKRHLFPYPSGWNPYHYAGYPLNVFYHPLFSYLVCLLSFLVPTKLAFKLIVCLSILAVLPAAYYLGAKLQLNSLEKTLWLIWVWAVLRFTPSGWGGNLYSAINLGEVANLLAIPFLFLHLAKAIGIFKGHEYFSATVLLSLTFLAHVYTGMAAILCFVGFALAHVKSGRHIIFSAVHLLFFFLLTSFWTIPFIHNIEYMKGSTLTFYGSPVLPLICFGFAVYLIFERRFTDPMVLAFLLLSIAIHFRYVPSLPLHFHRFRIYLAYLGFFPVLAFLKRRHLKIRIADGVFPLILVSIASFLNISSSKGQVTDYPVSILAVHGPPDVNIDLPRVSGRVLCVDMIYGNLNQQPRALHHLVAINTKNQVCDGLYMESAPNSRFLASIKRTLDQRSPIWSPRRTSANPNNLESYLRLFNINYVLGTRIPQHYSFLKPTPIEVKQSGILRSHGLPFRLYKLSHPSNLVEVLNYQPKTVRDNWDGEIDKWWKGDSIGSVLVYSQQPLPKLVGTGREKVEILEYPERGDRIRFNVIAQHDVPILIKISYFPNWRAFMNGRQIKIYKASPYLMLVYGHGIIDLRYERPTYEKLGYLVSIASLIGLTTAFTISRSTFPREEG